MKPRFFVLLLLTSCLRPSEDHARFDRRVGRAETVGVSVAEVDGLAAVHLLDTDRAVLWSASPVLHLSFDVPAGFRLTLLNVLPDAELVLDDGSVLIREAGSSPTVATFVIDGARTATLAPPDADLTDPYRVAVLSDVQEAIGSVQDIFERMRQDDELRFVVSTGDLTSSGSPQELERFQSELELLPIPFYSTVGNHEVPDPTAWHDIFGPFSSFFVFRGVAFSLVDSSNATIDPGVLRDRLQPWLDAHVDTTHVFLTHVPPLDASGLRSGAFRSRNEAARLIQRLAAADVDALFFGHVHSYYSYSLGGVDAYISGGGGAIQERLDGIERHYLRVELSAERGVLDVGLLRVD